VPEGASVDDYIPKNDKDDFLKCEIYVEPGVSNTTEKCSSYKYSGDIGHTIVSEVNL